MEMDIKRVDHLGIVAGTIKELGLIDQINKSLGSYDDEKISSGEAIAAVLINGLGFVTRPLMLAPQFFENKALSVLLRPGVKPEHLNRHKIGRVLDKVAEYGAEKLFDELASQTCIKHGVATTLCSLDTTTYSVSGEYDVELDVDRIEITHGYSKDHRPDLKQIVQELMVTQDGGVPLLCRAWNGNASDSIILRERATQMIEAFKRSGDRCLIADAKLYAKKTAPTLNKISYISRVPASIKEEGECITAALQQPGKWTALDNNYKLQEFPSNCFEIEQQRWIVVQSDHAKKRSVKTLNKQVEKERQQLEKSLFHLQAQRFACAKDTAVAMRKIVKKLRYHSVINHNVTTIAKHAKRGKPSKDSTPHEFVYQITGSIFVNQEAIDKTVAHNSCFVLSTNLSPERAPMATVLADYKGQDKVEKGFGFLKSPEFFASSLFLKSPQRIDALLMIMVLSLLVYSIAQRALRIALKKANETLPNQIKKPTATPTLRWIFQQFEGVDFATVYINNSIHSGIQGLTVIRKRILSFMSSAVQSVYQFSPQMG